MDKASDSADAVIDAVRDPPWGYYAAAALAAATLLLVGLGSVIAHGRRFAFDQTVMLGMRAPGNPRAPIGPAWLKQAMVDVTALGGETVLTLIVIVAAGFLLIARRWLTLALVLGGTISGAWMVAVLKAAVGRARPAADGRLVEVWSASFPSGHAATSAIVYLTLALLVMQIVERPALRRYLAATAALLVMLIGISRVYLGVHFPSDVVAGWSFGVLWALGWWWFGAWARVRRARARRGPPSDAARRPSARSD